MVVDGVATLSSKTYLLAQTPNMGSGQSAVRQYKNFLFRDITLIQ